MTLLECTSDRKRFITENCDYVKCVKIRKKSNMEQKWKITTEIAFYRYNLL